VRRSLCHSHLLGVLESGDAIRLRVFTKRRPQ
jgi:hypothetical protein